MRYGAHLAEKLPMRQDFQATIAIKHESGVGFGTAYWMQGDRVAFTTDAELCVDQRVEMRMDLSSHNEKARGVLLIIEVQDEEDDLSSCLGQILEMPREDFEALNNWLEDMGDGSSASHSSRWLKSVSSYRPRGSQASAVETAAALKRMDMRHGSTVNDSASGMNINTKRRVGRGAIRAALRANIQASTPVSAPNDASNANNSTLLDEPEIVTVSTPPPKTVNNAIDFNYTVTWEGANAARVQWTTKASLGQTWRSSLKKGSIKLKTPAPVPTDTQIKLSLVLPDGQTIGLRGVAGKTTGDEVECKVRVPWGTRVKLLHVLKD
ncbi:MAG: hypothetical protein QF872_06285 [Gammaproteobacteria bacterium]|nr:hypothetical protein [Gammaproteobacteria bacterium]